MRASGDKVLGFGGRGWEQRLILVETTPTSRALDFAGSVALCSSGFRPKPKTLNPKP